jgi:dimethylhistidine N-methyltransferase
VSDSSEFLSDVLAGLSRPQKAIPGKYLWDEAGSVLFDGVCQSPEYYVTRRENRLLQRVAAEVAERVGYGASLVEFGSGASRKARIVLDALSEPSRYVAVDISRAYLEAAVARLAADYPGLEVEAVCADYTKPLSIPPAPDGGPTLGFFPGSSIGNFEEANLVALLQRVRAALGRGWFLVGMDPNQDAASLRRAYGEGTPLMARFHGNLLLRMARELGVQIDPADFRHEARVIGPPVKVEAHLVAQKPTVLHVGGHSIALEQGESIHTDSSYKHPPETFRRFAEQAGWEPVQYWLDEENRFSLHLLRA